MRKKKVGRPKSGASARLTLHLMPSQFRKVLAASLATGLSMNAVVRRVIDEWTGKQPRNLDVPEN